MSNAIQIISLAINAIDLLVVVVQLCLTWARGAQCNRNDQARWVNETGLRAAKVRLQRPGTWNHG